MECYFRIKFLIGKIVVLELFNVYEDFICLMSNSIFKDYNYLLVYDLIGNNVLWKHLNMKTLKICL